MAFWQWMGLAVTAAVQSSSAAMVMVVGFVNSGLLTLGQAVGVIMGTNVGTTVTPWLLSLGGLEGGGFPGRLLRPAGFVPLLSLWGIIAYLSRNGRRRDTGQALLGFATLMQGMELMSGSVAGLAQAEGFRRLFTAFTDPLLGLLAGAVLTAVIQSSSASVGILQALAASGQVTVGAAVPIIMGQNIGTCITAMLSSVGASRNARRAALVHLLFNLTGAGVWLAVFWLVKVLAAPTMLARPVTLPGVAVIHTAFNLLCTMLLFPAAGLLERAVLRLLPGEDGEKGTALDPRLLAAPAAALEKCRELAGDMAALARDNLRRGVAAGHLGALVPARGAERRRERRAAGRGARSAAVDDRPCAAQVRALCRVRRARRADGRRAAHERAFFVAARAAARPLCRAVRRDDPALRPRPQRPHRGRLARHGGLPHRCAADAADPPPVPETARSLKNKNPGNLCTMHRFPG